MGSSSPITKGLVSPRSPGPRTSPARARRGRPSLRVLVSRSALVFHLEIQALCLHMHACLPGAQPLLQLLGTHRLSVAPSIHIFCEGPRLLVNAGENVQRYHLEKKLHIHRTTDVFVTSLSPRSTAGLVGLLLSLEGTGASSVTVWGPHAIRTLLELAKKSFAGLPRSRASSITSSSGSSSSSSNTSRSKGPRTCACSYGPCVKGTASGIPVEAYFLPHSSRQQEQQQAFNPLLEADEASAISDEDGAAAVTPAASGKASAADVAGADAAKNDLGLKRRKLASTDVAVDRKAAAASAEVAESALSGPSAAAAADAATSSSSSSMEAAKAALFGDFKETADCVFLLLRCPKLPGRFFPEKAKALGIPPGPTYARLKSGERIQLGDGRWVDPMEVCSEPQPGKAFAFVECLEPQQAVKAAMLRVEPLTKLWLSPPTRWLYDRAPAEGAPGVNETVDVALPGRSSFHGRGMSIKSQLSFGLGALPAALDSLFTPEALDELRQAFSRHLPPPVSRGFKGPALRILGTGSAAPSQYRNVSASILQLTEGLSVALDFGEGSLSQLRGATETEEEFLQLLLSLHAAALSWLRARLDSLVLLLLQPAGIRFVFLLAAANGKGLSSSLANSEASPAHCAFPSSGMSAADGCTPKICMRILELAEAPLIGLWFNSFSPLQAWFALASEQMAAMPHEFLSCDCLLASVDEPFSPAHLPPAAAAAWTGEAAALAIRTVEVDHIPESFGVRLDFNGVSLVYSGDTRPSPQLFALAANCTALLHEDAYAAAAVAATAMLPTATFEDGLHAEAVEKKHSCIGEVLAGAAQCGCEAIILTHFSQRYPKIPQLPQSERALLQDHCGSWPRGDSEAFSHRANASHSSCLCKPQKNGSSDREGWKPQRPTGHCSALAGTASSSSGSSHTGSSSKSRKPLENASTPQFLKANLKSPLAASEAAATAAKAAGLTTATTAAKSFFGVTVRSLDCVGLVFFQETSRTAAVVAPASMRGRAPQEMCLGTASDSGSSSCKSSSSSSSSSSTICSVKCLPCRSLKMSDAHSSPTRPAAGDLFTYIPLPLVYPPVDPPPGCSLFTNQQYPVQQQQGQLAALAAAAAATNATRQQLLHRMRQACLLHQRTCEAHQPSVARPPVGAPQGPPFVGEADLGAAAAAGAAGARAPSCGVGSPLFPSLGGASSSFDALHGGLSPMMGPPPGGALSASGFPRVSVGGGPPAENGLSDVQPWMERHRHALGVAEVYDGQLRLWRAFAAQLQLYLLLATQEAAAARSIGNAASSSSNSSSGSSPDSGQSPPAPNGVCGATLSGPSSSTLSSSSEGRSSVNRPEDVLGVAVPIAPAAAAAARSPTTAAAAPQTDAAAASAASSGQVQQQRQQQQQQQQQQQAPWRLRFIVMYLKLLVLLFLFDAGKWVYVACLFVALLHTNGAFNPILNLITSTSHRQPFEATLAQLRRRRERRPLQQLRLQQQRLHASIGRESSPPQNAAVVSTALVFFIAAAGAAASPAAANGDTPPTEGDRTSVVAADDSSSSSNSSRSSSSGADAWASSMSRGPHELRDRRLPGLEGQGLQPAASGAEGSGRSSGAGGFEMEGISPSSGRASAGAAVAAAGGAASGQRRRQRAAPPYWKRALYQGVAMFFLTTIPWWNPDPELLIDFEGLEEEADLSGPEAHDDNSPP
ncbi:hypothetical protein Emag_001483 [Eimeria magna]